MSLPLTPRCALTPKTENPWEKNISQHFRRRTSRGWLVTSVAALASFRWLLQRGGKELEHKANKPRVIYSVMQFFFPGHVFLEDWLVYLLCRLGKCKVIRHSNFILIPLFTSRVAWSSWYCPRCCKKAEPPAWEKSLAGQFDCVVMRAGEEIQLSTFTVTHEVYRESSTCGEKAA